MKLEDYSIEDLHQMALNEFDNDASSVELLQETYTLARNMYLIVFKRLRALAEAPVKP